MLTVLREFKNTILLSEKRAVFQMKQEKQDQTVVRKLIKVAILSLIFMSVEIIGGSLANSISILADAFHLLSDVLSYAISLFAVMFTLRKAPMYLTFGYEKIQPLGVLANVVIIWVVTVELCIEATSRIFQQERVTQPLYMLLTSIFGLGCNLIIMKILHSDPEHGHQCSHNHGQHGHSHIHHEHAENGAKTMLHKNPEINRSSNGLLNAEDEQLERSCKTEKRQLQEIEMDGQSVVTMVNETDHLILTEMEAPMGQSSEAQANKQKLFENISIRAAYVHIISDIILSVGVILSATLIFIFADSDQWNAWQLVDPFCTYFFSVVAIYSTISLTKQSLVILLDGCDDSEIISEVRHQISNRAGLKELTELKIWTANRGKYYGWVKATANQNREGLVQDIKEIMDSHNINSAVQVQ